jgi:16S rRNA (cytosine1402-N4)-methyltransferase
MEHVPVLLNEVLGVMMPQDGGRYFDGTLGDGGHARALLEASSPGGELSGTDLDGDAITRLSKEFERYGKRVHFFHTNFTEINLICTSLGWKYLDGILLDLGMSSYELDDGARGFSFSRTGPLDMRFSQHKDLDAYQVVNTYDQEQLAHLIRANGEERFARRIARRIVELRPIATTSELSDVVCSAIPRRFWPKKIHPATKTFQAIRMEVNKELDNLREFLPKASSLLSPGGVLAVISYHSLEDRMVKQFFTGTRPGLTYPRGLPVPEKTSALRFERMTRKPITASQEEVRINPRARSARLRAARRVS